MYVDNVLNISNDCNPISITLIINASPIVPLGYISMRNKKWPWDAA